jgi:hypothetical protein
MTTLSINEWIKHIEEYFGPVPGKMGGNEDGRDFEIGDTHLLGVNYSRLTTPCVHLPRPDDVRPVDSAKSSRGRK